MEAGAEGAAPSSARSTQFRLWSGVLPAAVCDAMRHELDGAELYDSEILDATGAQTVRPEQRSALHTFIEPAHWCGSFVQHFAREGNAASWNLDLANLGTLSFIRYEPGSHFDWHVDVLGYGSDATERKVSVTVNLSPADDYEGGDLEFLTPFGQTLPLPATGRQQGSIVVFPSTVAHRVTPVTSGCREVLVGWMFGPPLR